MKIRKYKNSDCESVAKLFFETIHSVNVKDYTEEQLFAWANSYETLTSRRYDLIEQNTLVAEISGEIVGFGSIDNSGCLDLLFVHQNHQRQGIATTLCDELEKGFPILKTYASITAKPFFENRGYVVIRTQKVERSGYKLKNYEMLKIMKTQ